jgi:UDP-GlcNAc:undecaprenyl-phosphate/decaprenyl-phosphate GlcNAc-1-phosphate transferase
MITLCIAFFLATFLLVYLTIPVLIKVSYKKKLFTYPAIAPEINTTKTPVLGGVAIFGSLTICLLLFLPAPGFHQIKYIIGGAFILFLMGLAHDLSGITIRKKFIIQVLVCLLVVIPGGFRMTSLYGVWGINELPYFISVLISILFTLLVVNIFNLIDRINYLAAAIGLLICLGFTIFFWEMKAIELIYLSLGMCGCLLAFLYKNHRSTKIFMGDTGSMVTGFIISVLVMRFMELNHLNTAALSGIKSFSALLL